MLRNLFNHVLHKARFRPLLHCNTIKELPNSRNMSKTLDLEVNRIVWFDLEVSKSNKQEYSSIKKLHCCFR